MYFFVYFPADPSVHDDDEDTYVYCSTTKRMWEGRYCVGVYHMYEITQSLPDDWDPVSEEELDSWFNEEPALFIPALLFFNDDPDLFVHLDRR